MIIVTGGAGFIGSNLVAALEERSLSRLVICDILGTDSKWKNISKRDVYDIVHPSQLLSFVEMHKNQIQMIFHMGAVASATEVDVDLILHNNFRLSLDLLNWCSRHRIRFIYASSAITYGGGEHGFTDGYNRQVLARLSPSNPYAWSKHVFDRTIAQIQDAHSKDYPLPPQYVGLKFFNVYGPNEYHREKRSTVFQLFEQIRNGESVQLYKSTSPDYEDGGQTRDFIHVDDCLQVMLWLYDNPEVSGLFNLGTGKARSFKAVAETVCSAMHREPKIEYVDIPDQLKDKYKYFVQADMSSLRAAGFSREFMTLEEGVHEYVQRYLMSSDPYR